MLFVRSSATLALGSLLACSQATVEIPYESQIGLEITSPARGEHIPGKTVTVRGHVADQTDIASITIADRMVSISDQGDFELRLTVPLGLSLIHTVAKLNDGTEDRDSRAVLGGVLTSADTPADRALRMELGAETIATIGATAGRVLAESDLTAAVSSAGPVVKTGGGCFQATVGVASLEVGDIDVLAQPTHRGFDLDLTVTDISARAAASYSAACLDGSAQIGFGADSYHVEATVFLDVVEGEIHSTIEVHDSDIDGFVVALTGIEFLDDALINVDWIMGPALGWLIEKRLASTFETVLATVANRDMALEIAGSELIVRARPQRLELTETGGRLETSMSVFVPGADSPGYIATPADTPVAAQPAPYAGFDLRIDDEVFHQAFSALWSTGLLNQTIDVSTLGTGDFGGQLKAVSIEAKLPPAVHFGEMDEAPALVVGDLIIELIGPDHKHAAIAVSASMVLAAMEREDLGPGQTVLHAQPTLDESYIDVLYIDERSRGILDEDFLVTVTQAALKRAARQLGDNAGIIALPSFSGTTLVNPAIRTRPGYLQLEGELGLAN